MNFIFISTTSKHNTPFIELPKKYIFNKQHRNVLISDEHVLTNFLMENNAPDTIFVVDCEKKQGLSLFDIAKSTVGVKCIPYKPNDITLEATDLTILDHFNDSITNKAIAIYGTGNLATKLAIRLAERNAKIFIIGRNEKKVNHVVNCISHITFNCDNVNKFNDSTKLDCLISFVSGNEVIKPDFIHNMNNGALCLDGGIGNFSKSFIAKGNEAGLDIRRVDVRMGDIILEGHIKSKIDNPFYKYIGRMIYDDLTLVGGGIIGKENDVIVDNISEPSVVIGLADGFGGVKRKENLTDIDKERILRVNEYIRKNQ